MKILLVEDHELNRQMLARRLRRLGYEVITACDGEEGVSAAGLYLPDVILMDLSLPGINGAEATGAIRKGKMTQCLPVIALTGFVEQFDRDRALAAGCDDYETKPIDIRRLVAKIDRLGCATNAS